MLRLKLDKLLIEKEMSMYRLHILTGIRPNTIGDLVNNKAKQWSPDALDKIYKVLELQSVDDLFEYVDEVERKE